MQFEYIDFVAASDYAADEMNKRAREGGWRTIAVFPHDGLKVHVFMERPYQALPGSDDEPQAMGMRG